MSAMKEKKHTLLKLGLFTTATCASIKFINDALNERAILKNILFKKSQNFYDWKYGKVHYTKSGQGSPLLLLHDLTPSSSTNEWKYVVSSLSEDHTVYCVDMIGCGCSNRPKISYTSYFYVQMVTDFVKHVIGEKTDVIASGLSGAIAVMTAFNDPSVFGKMELVNPEDPAWLNKFPTLKSKALKTALELPLIGTLIYNMINSRESIELHFTEHYLYDPFHIDDQLVDSFYESAHLKQGNGKYLAASILGNFLTCNFSTALKKLDNDICIVYGEKENANRELAALYRSLNPKIQFETVSHSKHFPQFENPGLFLEKSSSFFK